MTNENITNEIINKEESNNEITAVPEEPEKKKSSVITLTIRIERKLLEDYTDFCKIKKTDRSKRLRNFMTFELDKEKAKIEAAKIEEATQAEKSKVIIYDEAGNIPEEYKQDNDPETYL